MSPEIRDRTFDPFFTTRPDKAVGLGLASVRSIVERFGGTIKAESASGKGACFHIFLPTEGVGSRLTG